MTCVVYHGSSGGCHEDQHCPAWLRAYAWLVASVILSPIVIFGVWSVRKALAEASKVEQAEGSALPSNLSLTIAGLCTAFSMN